MPIAPSAAAKFGRAQRHFDALRDAVDGFLKPKPYRLRAEANDDCTEHRFYLDFDPAVPSDEWGLLLGDGLQCLRSALDHTIYAIGVRESGMDPPPRWRSLQFPITENMDRWQQARRRVSSLSDPVQTKIEGLQPHGYAEEFFLRPLGALEELNNADKHRALRVVTCVPIFEQSLITGLIPGMKCSFDHHIGALEDGTPVVTISCAGSSPDVKMGSEPTLHVGVPWVRENGINSTLILWGAVDAMNKAVSEVITALAEFS